MNAVTTIYLARHGQSEMNNQKRVTGQLNPPLTQRGLAQSRALACLLAHEPIAAVYTSALERAVQTATPLAAARGLPITRLPALNEIHMGALQGRWRDERDPEAVPLWQQWQADMWHYRVPGGETLVELEQRAGTALREICARHAGARVLIVAHRTTNRVLLGTLLRLPRDEWPALKPSSKVVHRITLHKGRALEHIELALPKPRASGEASLCSEQIEESTHETETTGAAA